MGEEFEAAGVCGGNWWNSSRGTFGSSPCNSSINMNDHIGSFGWAVAGELVDMKGGTRSSEDSSDGGGATTTMDSTLQMMGIGLSSSSSTTEWNDQSLLGSSGRAESNYNPILQEDLNHHQETGVNYISPGGEASNIQANQGYHSIQQPSLSTGQCVATCQGLANFPISSTSYVYTTTLLQTLFDNNSPPEQSAYDDGSMNYSSNENNYRTNLSEFSPCLPKLSSMVKPKQHVSGQWHSSNNTPFWNANSASALNDIRASFFSSAQSEFLPSTFQEKPKFPNLTPKSNQEEIRNSGSVVKKIWNEPAFKRPRLETPSPLPTFKVRKEKLGDRITALQQLVSPFGKTDTASVLHDAIEHIKLLHDQVNVLSAPYMKNGASMRCQQIPEKVKEIEGAKQDLKSRGLCLVPVSSTFPVAAETTAADFWTANFGGAFM